MGIKIITGDDDEHIITMNTLDFFPVETPQEFVELMRSKRLNPKHRAYKNSKNIWRKRIKHSRPMKTQPTTV